MSKETPDNTDNPTKMSFHRFINWACGRMLIGLGAGERLRDLMTTIIDNAVKNEHFGGTKRK